MNHIEEQLWSYIDGTCTVSEQEAISKLIAADEAVRLKYQQLLALNSEFAAMELEEPPMAFTYNVIEAIRTEQAQVPLKAAINKRIILGISIFFIVTITAFLVFVFTQFDLSAMGTPKLVLDLHANIKLPKINEQMSKPIVEGFMFFDLVLGLFLFDKYLRRKRVQKQME